MPAHSGQMQSPLRFRQIHLDFHTSGAIDGIGSRFNKKRYQEALKRAEVNSVTTFALCHHGWSYYDTQVGQRHPHLSFDLLRAQFDACKELDINVPIYLTAGVNNVAADANPGWREIDPEGRFSGWSKSNLEAGFKMLSFHSPYLQTLCDQTREVVALFPDADGIFFDIINQSEDCSVWALQHMQEHGLDPTKKEDRLQSRMDALMKYYIQSTAAVRDLQPEMPVFHNAGHVTPGFREILPFFSHLELESLPTGGWGYDHFPVAAKHAAKLGMDFLGMTGKFHSSWGEFGGYKHPNALKYECCAMLAYGARCSVGDQLHPTGEIDDSTYEIIGEAYREVARKERFVVGAANIADVGLLSSQAVRGADAYRQNERELPSDIGAARVLLEEHVLFDILDPQMDISAYKMLVLPDDLAVDAALETRLKAYLEQGGKLFLTSDSGIIPDRGMIFDIGAEVGGHSEFQPDYWLPKEGLRADFVNRPMVMYGRSRRLQVTDGESLGEVYDPYFNRTWDHFCSHQHTPPRPDASGFAAGVRKGGILYLAHPVFTIYRSHGQVALRQTIGRHLDLLLGDDSSLQIEGFPSTARVTLTHQAADQRFVLHLLNGVTINRGGAAASEVIEDVRPIHDIHVRVRVPERVTAVTAQPEGQEISFSQDGDFIEFGVDRLLHHQMVVISY